MAEARPAHQLPPKTSPADQFQNRFVANEKVRQTAFRYPDQAKAHKGREMALELVCGADFSCKLMFRASPGDLGGSRVSISVGNPGKTGPKISSQTAFRYPAHFESNNC